MKSTRAYEVYTSAHVLKAYEEFTEGTKLRGLDLKQSLDLEFKVKFSQCLKLAKLSYNSSYKTL